MCTFDNKLMCTFNNKLMCTFNNDNLLSLPPSIFCTERKLQKFGEEPDILCIDSSKITHFLYHYNKNVNDEISSYIINKYLITYPLSCISMKN